METIDHPLQLRILIIEDKEDDFNIIRDYINNIPEKKFRIDWSNDYQDALEAIQRSSYALYFVDAQLAGKTGLDLLTEAMIDGCEAPIIMLTGKANAADDKKATQLGAYDYLVKSELNSEKLERCIRYALNRSDTLKELGESERQYRNIFERTTDVFFIADARLRFRKVNEATSSIFGYTESELLGMTLPDLFFSADDKGWVTNQLMQKGSINDYQLKLKTKEDKKIGLLSASLEADSNGHRYVQGIIHEITLLKRAEEVAIQTEKLEAKARVIRTLAHEVRNPLNNIQLSIANLKSDTTHTFEYLEIIDRNSKRINDLIGELMDTTSYHKMNMERISLQSVLYDTLEVVHDRLSLGKIKLFPSFAAVNAFAFLDRDKMRMAFLNLIINAIESMSENPEGLITVTINYRPDFHEVKIEDTGCGMTEETRQKLFEPYYTTKPNGLGLGLATTHAILVLHKATLQVTSEVGKGSVFTLTFPTL